MIEQTRQRRFTPLAPTPRIEDLHSLENTIICGDCKDRMFEHIPDDSIDLIYMDPPFFSGTQYDLMWGDDSKATIQSFEDAAFYKKVCGKCNADWGKDTKGNDFELCDNYKCDGVLEDAKDVRKNDIETYLGWLKDRIDECYRVLKPTGSIYVHLDWHAVHYVKVMMDEIFGYDNFQNEIVWCYHGGGLATKMFKRKHDTILFYTKSNTHTFNPQYKREKSGKEYKKGVTIKNPPVVEDWWADIPSRGTATMSKEWIGYPTQKPESLLVRIIEASSNPGDIVLDPFCGCGTTITVAQRLSRRWIGIDIEPISCTVQQARMERTYDKEFPIIDLGKQLTEAEAKQATIDARKMDPFAFQKWAVTLLGGKPNSRVVGDDGIDGWIVDPHADLVRGDLIQVKRSDSVGKDVIKLHAYNIQKHGVTGGLVIGFGFTSGSHDEVKAIRETGINIELLTVKNMMMQTGKNVKSCGKQSTSKQAIL